MAHNVEYFTHNKLKNIFNIYIDSFAHI